MKLALFALIVEDDIGLLNSLRMILEDEGFNVFTAGDCAEAKYLLSCHLFDVVILDGHLPDGDCFSLLLELQKDKLHSPVMLLTARSSLEDKVKGLNAGADDYITKPFNYDEFIARVYAMLRRWSGSFNNKICIQSLTINYRKKSVVLAGTPINLTHQEYTILICLALRKGQLMTRLELFDRLNSDSDIDDNLLDVLIYNLRKKVGKTLIQTIRGHGVRLSS